MNQKDLEIDTRLIILTCQPGWTLYPPSQLGYVRIDAPDKASCYWLTRQHGDALDRLANRFSVILGYKNAPAVIWIPQTMNNSSTEDQSPILQLGQRIRLSIPLLRVVETMLSDSSVSYSLVRLSDQAQVAVNGGSGGRFLAGAALEDTVTWAREDYWQPSDLADFNRAFRQEQTPNSDRWFEYRYRARNPALGLDLQQYNMQLVTRYKLIDDGFGQLYHLGQNVELILP